MPVPSRFGVYASQTTAGGGVFVGITSVVTAATSVILTPPLGTVVGDLCFVHIPYQGSSGQNAATISGWTKDFLADGAAEVSAVFRKVLTGGDMAGFTLNNPGALSIPIVVISYHGPTVATLKSSVTADHTTTLTFPGFTKSPSFKALVNLVTSRDPASTMIPPGTFTIRGSYVASGFFVSLEADIVNSLNYTNGTSVVWTGFVGSGGNAFQTGFQYELT